MDHSGNRSQQGFLVSPSGEIMKRATEGRKGSPFPRKQAKPPAPVTDAKLACPCRQFSLASVPFAFATWIMTSVMLSYNGRPLSNHPLTRPFSHLLVFSGIAVIWSFFLIMFATQTAVECNNKEPSDGLSDAWCFLGKLEIGFTCGMIAFAGASIFSIYFTVKRNNIGLSGNIATGDKKFAKQETNYNELT
jgi:hypothetical protein